MVFNTGETSEGLKARYNPEGSILKKAQDRLLDMLLYLDEICKEQNIQYRIDAGNVLGAVRHGGFIPWDDDMDIVLLRKDYKKLCKYLRAHEHPQYKLQTFNSDYGYVAAWSVLRDTKSEYIQESIVHNARKYRGLQVDIFPYENRIIKPFYKFSSYITEKNHNWLVGRVMPLARFIHILQFNVLHPLFRCAGRFFGNPDIYMHAYGARFKVEHSKEGLFPYKDLIFEGIRFPGPANTDIYLKEHYGNYHDLPPLEQRSKHHAQYRIWD